MESKYRWRQAKRQCPSCGAEAIIRGKAEYGGGWLCWKKQNGCGAKFAATAPEIVAQVADRIENPDLADTFNTVLKMAKKRCLGSTTPMLYLTDRSVVRSNVSKMYQVWLKASKPIFVPDATPSWRLVRGMSREEGRKVLRVDLSDGSYIRATEDHRWPSGRGLVYTSELEVGDVLERFPLPDTLIEGRSADIDFAYLAGMYLADGSTPTDSSVKFTFHADRTDLAMRIAEGAARVGATSSIKNRKNGNTQDVTVYGLSFRGLMEQFINGHSAYNKHLTRHAWSQGRQSLSELLRGYLECDAHYQTRPGRKQHWILGFTGENHELADDLRSLGVMMGWRTQLNRVNESHLFGGKPCYTGWLKPQSSHGNVKSLEEVVRITEEDKPAVVYDIEVDGDHLFCLANGLQTHNSLVDATLTATAASDLFTQDLEDLPRAPKTQRVGAHGRPLAYATAAQVRRLQTCIDRLALPAEHVHERLAVYDAARLEDLTAANARLILTKLDAALVERDKKTTAKEP